MELATALSCCGSSSTTEKKEGLKALFTIISSEKQVNTMDLKKIVERLNPLIGEGAHKVCNFKSFYWAVIEVGRILKKIVQGIRPIVIQVISTSD